MARSDRSTELSRSLRALRERAGLSQVELALAAQVSQAEVSRTETGVSVPDEDKLPRLLVALHATPEQTQRLLAMAGATRRSYEPAKVLIQRGVAQFQQRLLDIEDQAELVRSYAPTAVLGVLQTEAYARAVWADNEQAARKRLARGQQLLDGSDRQWRLIQSEGALRWNLGGAAVMAEQIEHITTLTAALPNVRFGIVPWHTHAPQLVLHGFHIYDFPDRKYRRDPRMVQVGTHTGTALLGEDEAPTYVDLFTELEQIAIYGDQAHALLTRIGDEYRQL